jgi:hypothetical protein
MSLSVMNFAPFFLILNFLLAPLGYGQPLEAQLRELGAPESLITEFRQLERQRAGLGAQLNDLQGPYNEGGINELFVNHSEAVQRFSDSFHDYRVRRTIALTRLSHYAFLRTHQLSDFSSTEVAEVNARMADFEAAAAKVQLLGTIKDRSSREYTNAKKVQSDNFSGVNSAHRQVMFTVNRLVEAKAASQPTGAVLSVLTKIRMLTSWHADKAHSVIENRLVRKLERHQEPFRAVDNLLTVKNELAGIRVMPGIEGSIAPPLKSGEVNVIIPPHGNPEEVALLSARIATELPAGRKVAILLAPYHFLGEHSDGLRIANLIRDHPNFIAVLAETSRFADQTTTAPVTQQIKEFVESGGTDIVIFAEGRNTGVDGGLTGADPNTIRLLPLLKRIKVNTSNGEMNIEAKVTVLSAVLPNLAYGTGVGSDAISIHSEPAMSEEVYRQFQRDANLGAATLDTVWALRGWEVNKARLGFSASESAILGEMIERFNPLRMGCGGDGRSELSPSTLISKQA